MIWVVGKAGFRKMGEESAGREVPEVKFYSLKVRGGISKGASAEGAALSNNIWT
jgi:hypothetical protein